MALERSRPFSYVKSSNSFESADCLPRNRPVHGYDEEERPKTMSGRSGIDLNEFQLMRSKLRTVSPSPKPSPRQIWHPQENFIGPLQNYVPADCKKEASGENKLVRTVSPTDFLVPRSREVSPEKKGPVPRPRTRGRSPQRKVILAASEPSSSSAILSERPKQGLAPSTRSISPGRTRTGGLILERPKTRGSSPEGARKRGVSPQKARRNSMERPKMAKVVPDSPEERDTTRFSPDPAICRACGMSPERNFYTDVRPKTCGTYPDGIILSPRQRSRMLSPSPERPYRSPSPIKFVTPVGVVMQDAFPNLRQIRSRSSTPDLEVKKSLAIYLPKEDEFFSSTSSHCSSSPRRPKSASPVGIKGKPPKQPGAHLSENSPRTHWIVDRPCRSPSPLKIPSPRGPSPSRGINAYMKQPSRGPSPARSDSRPRPPTSREQSPMKMGHCCQERISTAPAKRKQSPPPRSRGGRTASRSNSRGRSQSKTSPTRKTAAIKLLDPEPELAYTIPTMAIIKTSPDLPPPHTKLRPESPERRPRSRSKNSAAFVVWKEQKIELPERMLPSPKKEVKKGVKINEKRPDSATMLQGSINIGGIGGSVQQENNSDPVAYQEDGDSAGMAANVEMIRQAQEALAAAANASNENAAIMFDKALRNMKQDANFNSDNMFNAVSAAVNMQQEKVSITSGDRAAAFHDEHADGERDDLPELISEKSRRGSMRFSALGKIAGMGARSTINQRKKMEQEAASSAKDGKSMSRTSSRASMAESKGGILSKSASQTSLNKMRSASGVLGSITSLASNKSTKSGKGTGASNSPISAVKKVGRMSANAAYRAVTAASSLVRSPRSQSNQSLNKTGVAAADDSDAESVTASTPRGMKSRMQSRDSSNTIISAHDGSISSNSRSSSMASVIAATPPVKRNTNMIDSAAATVMQLSRMQGRRQSLVMQNQPLIATISATPTPSTPAMTMKEAGSATGKMALTSGGMAGGSGGGAAANPSAPAAVEVVSEVKVPAGGPGKGGGGFKSGVSKMGAATTMGTKKSKGNETMGEELIARMDSVNISEMEETVSLPPSCCGFRGAWAQKLAAKKWPGLCTKCIKTPKPPDPKKWAKTRKGDLNADPEMQPTDATPQKKRLIDRLKCCVCCKRKTPNSASSQAPVLPKATPPKLTFGQKLKRIFTCAALRMSCSRCCAKMSCRGCCAKISLACCCPCFAKCARCCPCCNKCCKKGAVGDSTPNPLNKSQPSLQSKRKSRSLPPDPIMRKLDPSLLEANSIIQTAIPVLPVSLAWICLVLNCVLPGLGTIMSGAFCLCIGRPRFSVEDRPEERLGTFCLNIMVGIGQFFTVLFCLVGWGWSIWWGTIMVKLAKKHRRLMVRAAEELAKPPNPRRPSDPANKK